MLPEKQPANEDVIAAFSKWLRRKHPNTSTPRHYVSDVKLFFAGLNKPAHDIRVSDIDAFIQDSQARRHRAATINRRLASLHVFFDWLAIEREEPCNNPVMPRRHYIRVGQRLPRDADDATLKALFEAVVSPRDRAMFGLMLRCGLRVGEIASLSLQDVQLTSPANPLSLPRLRVHGKGGCERTAYLSSQAGEVLKIWLGVRPAAQSDAVFVNRHGQRMSVNGIQYVLGQACRRAGVHLTCHQFRHAFGRHMVEAGAPVTSIQRLLGHHWLQSTEVYLHVSDPRLQADYDAAMRRIAADLTLDVTGTSGGGR